MQAVRPHDRSTVQGMADAMAAVVTDWGRREPTPIEADSFDAIGRFILRRDIDLGRSNPVPGAHLTAAMADPDVRLFTLRLCMALALTPGFLDAQSLARLEQLARLLDVRVDGELRMLRWALAKRHKRLLTEVTLHAATDYWGKGGRPKWKDWMKIAEQAFFIGAIRRPGVAERYRALAKLPAGSLGRAIFDFYNDHDYRLPGEKGSMPEHFILHECTHILAGYGTDPVGEMLVAVFTAGAKKRNVMDWVFVSLLQWHLGANVGSFTIECAHQGLLDPPRFFESWGRGMETNISLMDDPWSWWDVIETDVDELRAAYNIEPIVTTTAAPLAVAAAS